MRCHCRHRPIPFNLGGTAKSHMCTGILSMRFCCIGWDPSGAHLCQLQLQGSCLIHLELQLRLDSKHIVSVHAIPCILRHLTRLLGYACAGLRAVMHAHGVGKLKVSTSKPRGYPGTLRWLHLPPQCRFASVCRFAGERPIMDHFIRAPASGDS